MILVCLIPIFLFHIRNLAVAYALIFMVFCIARFFLPAKLAIVPDLVSREQLLIANSLINITGMIAFILGSGLSGVLVQKVGPENSFYIDGLSFLISGTLIYLIVKKASGHVNLRKVSEDIVEVFRKSAIQEIKDGLLYFVRKRDIWVTAGILFVVASALGVVSVVSIVFVQNTLHSATKDLGLLIMFLGAGLFAGSLVYGKFGAHISHYKMIFSSLILSGLMLICFALGIHYYPYFAPAASLAFMLGFIASPILIASNTIIHKSSDNEMRGKIFSSLEVVMHLGFLLFMYISSILAERFSHTLILVIIGCVFGIVGIFNLIYHRKIPWLEKI